MMILGEDDLNVNWVNSIKLVPSFGLRLSAIPNFIFLYVFFKLKFVIS